MNYPIIPKPQSITAGDRPVFTLTRLCEIEGEQKFPKAAAALKKFLEESFDISLLGTGREKISLSLSEEISHEEGYTLSVKEDEVIIKGRTEKGIFYGIQTLKQMLMYGELTLCEAEITDEPNMDYRGFLLDCGRYFFTKEAVSIRLLSISVTTVKREKRPFVSLQRRYPLRLSLRAEAEPSSR